MLIYFIIALNLSKLCYLFCRNVEFFKITLIHQQNVEVKNVNGIKRRQTKRFRKNAEWDKTLNGKNADRVNSNREKTLTETQHWKEKNIEWRKHRLGQNYEKEKRQLEITSNGKNADWEKSVYSKEKLLFG